MLLSESAVETLDKNSPNGLLESVFELVNFSTWARYFLASVVSPDLIEENKPVSAVSNEFALFDELEVEEVEEAASSLKSVMLLEILEIDMACSPFLVDFSRKPPPTGCVTSSYTCGLHVSFH